eukprot:g24533.t1
MLLVLVESCRFVRLADLTCFGIGPGIFYTRQALGAISQHSSPAVSISTVMPLVAGYAYVRVGIRPHQCGARSRAAWNRALPDDGLPS